MSLLIGVKNTTSQTVDALGAINLGTVYRRYCKKNNCGFRTFETDATSVTLQQQGIYHVTVTLVGTATAAGDVTVSLLENAIATAFTTETVTTPVTELHTFVIDQYVIVDNVTLLGSNTVAAKTLSLQNTGVEATFTSVTFNVEKVV
jgi:hypothetical protein